MLVWSVWQLTGWVVDPHYLVRLQTFRQRAAEVSLAWRDDTSSVREVVPRLHEGAEAHEGVEERTAQCCAHNRLPTRRINTVSLSQAEAQTQGGSNLEGGATSLLFRA